MLLETVRDGFVLRVFPACVRVCILTVKFVSCDLPSLPLPVAKNTLVLQGFVADRKWFGKEAIRRKELVYDEVVTKGLLATPMQGQVGQKKAGCEDEQADDIEAKPRGLWWAGLRMAVVIVVGVVWMYYLGTLVSSLGEFLLTTVRTQNPQRKS